MKSHFNPKSAGIVLWVFSLFAVATAVFGVGLESSFIFDDIAKIRDNPDLRISRVDWNDFLHDYSEKRIVNRNDPSRPLTFLLYRILWQAGSGDVLYFHWASLLLHVACSVFVGWLALKMASRQTDKSLWPAAVVASFSFLLLTINAGTVAYAYGLSDQLSAFFVMAFVVVALDTGRFPWFRGALALLLYMAAVFSKQSALIAPALLLCFDFLRAGPHQIESTKRNFHFVFFSFAILYLLWRFWFFGRLGDMEAEKTFAVQVYAPLQGIMIWQYLSRLLVPTHLTIDQSWTPSMFEIWECVLAWGALIVISSVLAGLHLFKGRLKWLSLAWFFFLVSLLPTSSLFPTTDLMVERRAYLASAGFCFALAGSWTWASNLMGVRTVLRAALGALIVSFLLISAVLSHERVKLYGDEEKLWREAIQLFPRNERARINLSTYYLQTNQLAQARKELDELLQMYPSFDQALINLAIYYQHPQNPLRNIDKSIELYEKARQSETNDLTTLLNLGLAYLEKGLPLKAIEVYQRVLQLNGHVLQARFGLIEAALKVHDKELAREQARSVLRLEPENSKAKKILESLSQ